MKKWSARFIFSVIMILGITVLFWECKLKEDSSSFTFDEKDGEYTIEATLSGGSGKATIASPMALTIKEHEGIALVEWSSPNYDYMLVDGEKIYPVNIEGDSVFEVPVSVLDEEMPVTADTTAMSVPHEIEYTLTFHSDTIKSANGKESEENKDENGSGQSQSDIQSLDQRDINISPQLTYKDSLELSYAKRFAVDYYEEGHRLLSLADGSRFLVVPQNGNVPKNLESDIVVLKHPVTQIYLVASASMDMFCELSALDHIRFSGQKSDGWYIEEAKEAMKAGKILYAGKYSMPDYELILSEGCSLAIENTMISHTPEVAEKLEEFDIPVMIDYSSYETHPLGRAEWIKFYGALLGKEQKAEEIFKKQEDTLNRVSLHSVTSGNRVDKTVAFFYITSNGTVNVRKSSDYLPQMIEFAGGKYVFDDLGSDSDGKSSVNMTMEEFYAAAREADCLLYNSTIDGEIQTIGQLLEKSNMLEDFKAVKDGNVWCTTNELYQHPMSVGDFTEDLYKMLSGESDENMKYIYRLKQEAQK